MRKFSFLRIRLLLLVIGTTALSNWAQKMPIDANAVYEAFSAAINNKDIKVMESVLCRSSFIKMKNEALSMGVRYPDEVLETMKSGLPEFKNFRYLSYKKVGPTINAYYLYGENNQESNIITMCLLEENGGLRLIELKVRDAKDYIINLHNKDYSFLELKEYQPSGIAPELPIAIENVDYIAYLDISCYGYKVSVSINSIFQQEVKNRSRSGVVIGGIKKGENTINMTIEKTDPTETEKPSITLRGWINEKEVEVFFYNEDAVGEITRSFNIN